MTTQKKVLKGLIIFILVAFLLSTALTSIMYLGGKGAQTTTGENLTGIAETTAIVETTGTVDAITDIETVATGEVK